MICLLLTLSPVVLDLTELRYLRPEGGKYVLESKVEVLKNKSGSLYTSKTYRGKQILTLSINRDKEGRFLNAEIVNDIAGTKTTAKLERRGEVFRLTRNGVSEDVKAPLDALFTSAPDWSDIFELVHRYELTKKGKQEFAGLWFHPKQPTLTPTFTIELKGTDKVKVKDREIVLNRFEVKIRASTNRVWALPDGGAVIKIAPAIVLEGYEEATRALK